jgi:hypothetical protein
MVNRKTNVKERKEKIKEEIEKKFNFLEDF